MGKKALAAIRRTSRSLRDTPLTASEKAALRDAARYEGVPYHKRNPGDFGLTPPSAPRPDKTLCDEAGVTERAVAADLLIRAIDDGLCSEGVGAAGFPKQMWAVDDRGQVFEAMYGGSTTGAYHGYPIRKGDPLFEVVTRAWEQRHG